MQNLTSISLFPIGFSGKNGEFGLPVSQQLIGSQGIFLHIPMGEHLIH